MIQLWNNFTAWRHIDKLVHFGVGAFLASALLAIGAPAGLASLAVFTLAGYKELRDRLNPEKHTFDGWDAYWTHAGSVWALLAPSLVALL